MSYKDPLKIFMEIKLNQIPYFKGLPKHVKNEFIFNMEIRTYEKGAYIYRDDDASREMYLV